MQGWLKTRVESYDALSSALSVSIRLVEERRGRWGFRVHLSAAEMHRRLSVLVKRSRVPMTMLAHLWGLKNEAEATIVAREFEQIAFATVSVERVDSEYVELLGMHDCIHAYASGETRERREERLGHVILLEGYGHRLEKEQGCRAWWSTRVPVDGYLHNHICRHLLLAGLEEELVNILLKPEWTVRSFMVCGILSLERDYKLGIAFLKKIDDESFQIQVLQNVAHMPSDILMALENISEAARLSCGFKVDNQRKFCFQVYGRLSIYSDQSLVIQEYLARLEENGKRLCGPWLRCTSSFLTTPGGAMTSIYYVDSWVRSMVLSDDGSFAYCGCDDGNILFVNLKSNEVQELSGGHGFSVDGVMLSDDGDSLYSGSAEVISKWDTQTGALQSRSDLTKCEMEDILAIAHGRVVMRQWGSKELRVRDLTTEILLCELLNLHSGEITCVAALLDGEHFVSGDDDGSLRVWNAADGEQKGDDFIGHEDEITCVGVMPDGRHIVSGSDDGTLRMWDIETKLQVRKIFNGEYEMVRCVAASRDGRRVAAGFYDTTVAVSEDVIRVWDVTSEEDNYKELKGHTREVSGVVFHPVDDILISYSMDNTIRVWDLNRTNVERVLDQHQNSVLCASFTSDGRYVVSGSEDASLRIWDVNSGTQVGTPLQGHSSRVTGVGLTPDGQRVVSASWDKTVRVWDFESHDLISTFTGYAHPIIGMALTPNGHQVVTSALDRTILVLDLTVRNDAPLVIGQFLMQSSTDIRIYGLAWNNGRVFVTDDGLRVVGMWREALSLTRIFVWSLESQLEVKRIERIVPQWWFTRKEVIELVDEGTMESIKPWISLKGKEIWYIGEEEVLLGLLEAESNGWIISPDKKTLCVGTAQGQVSIMKLEA